MHIIKQIISDMAEALVEEDIYALCMLNEQLTKCLAYREINNRVLSWKEGKKQMRVNEWMSHRKGNE